jgi:hypothetical protein
MAYFEKESHFGNVSSYLFIEADEENLLSNIRDSHSLEYPERIESLNDILDYLFRICEIK